MTTNRQIVERAMGAATAVAVETKRIRTAPSLQVQEIASYLNLLQDRFEAVQRVNLLTEADINAVLAEDYTSRAPSDPLAVIADAQQAGAAVVAQILGNTYVPNVDPGWEWNGATGRMTSPPISEPRRTALEPLLLALEAAFAGLPLEV